MYDYFWKVLYFRLCCLYNEWIRIEVQLRWDSSKGLTSTYLSTIVQYSRVTLCEEVHISTRMKVSVIECMVYRFCFVPDWCRDYTQNS